MIIRLPRSLKYPITITKLLRQPNDDVRRLEPLLVYKYETIVTEYPAFGEERKVVRELSAQFDAPIEGRVDRWMIKEGSVVETSEVEIIEIEEPCTHEIQWGGLCTMCGKDMTEQDYTYFSNKDRATIQVAHDNTGLTVSQNEAQRLEEDAKRRLLKAHKLSLVVDLDQTIIHATVDPTVGEWKTDPSCINHDSVKDVQAFKLDEDVIGGRGTWYYVKTRPGLKEFLEHVSKIYELHIYTMGTRAYAMSVKKIVDPDGSIFGDRVLSRDESGSMTQKSLHRLFPIDTKMVVIIDDRGDVWKWSENLVKVRPYDFFIGIGDINSMFLPKRQEFPPGSSVAPPTPESLPSDNKEDEKIPETETQPIVKTDTAATTATITTPTQQLSTLEQLITMGGGDGRQILSDQTEELNKALNAQKEDRPLAKKQEIQDKIDEKAAETSSTTDEGDHAEDTASDSGKQKHSVLQDHDRELPILAQHLSSIHSKFYEEYEMNKGQQRDRVSQLKRPRRQLADADGLDLRAVPDVKQIMPTMKNRALSGTVLVFSGVIPLGADVHNSDIAMWSKTFGAIITDNVTFKVTHVVAARSRTAKVRQAAAKYPHIKIVNPQWLYDSISSWEHLAEEPYLITIHPDDRQTSLGNGLGEVGPLLSSEDEDTDGGDFDQELLTNNSTNGVPNMDVVGWTDVNEEFEEFMAGEDLDDDSDGESVNSMVSEETSVSTSTLERRGKRSRSSSPGSATQPVSDAGDPASVGENQSRLSKRQKIARERPSSGLRAVEPANGETGDAEQEEEEEFENTQPSTKYDEEDDDSLAEDLERELLQMQEEEDQATHNADPEKGADDGGG